MRARTIAQTGVITAVYAVLTFVTIQFLPLQLGSGLVQFRVSEALTVLAALTPAAVPGLAVGSALANLTSVQAFGPVGLLDVVFGSTATLLGALWTWRFRDRTALALAGPVVFNALIVPAYLPAMLRAGGITSVFGVSLAGAWWLVYAFGVASVGIGEAVVVYGLGWPLLSVLRRMRLPGLTDGA